MVKNIFFFQKAQYFVFYGPYDFVQISLVYGRNPFFKECIWRDFRLPMSALAMVAQKSFNGKFIAKIDFPIRHFMLPLLLLTLEV